MAPVQDLVVIGAGSGGFAAAMRAAQLGGQVTLVEQALFGGNCMNHACIPSKVLTTAVRLVGAARKAERLGVRLGEPRLDMSALHQRKDLIVESLRLGTEQLLTARGVNLLQGQARLVTRDTVEVNGQRLRARCIILATGSVAAQIPVQGADLPGVIGTEEAMALQRIPDSVAILGSRPWEIELAQYWRFLGAEVTLVEAGRQLLPGADREIAQRLGKLLHDAGITIKRAATVEAIQPGPGDALTVVLAEGKGEIVVDTALAARRLPNSTGLGLRQLGIKTEGGAVPVNEHMETNLPGVYAIGDLAAIPLEGNRFWSHKANVEGIVAGENAMGLSTFIDYSVLPFCIYSWPEVAWVGLTEDQAEALQIEVSVGKVPMAINPMAMILDETVGMVKVIASKRYGKILGVHIMAPGAGDLINTAGVAMLSEATVDELMRFIPAHPAIGEALVDAAMDVEGRSLHVPDW
jgi:dihydrolipoamide dehydrogenase